ncbi:hypothetical protein OHQ90_18155 [Nocardia sp. NBC_00403]
MGEFVAAIGQHAQRHQVIVGSHSQQIRSMQGHKGNRVRIGGVGLTALTGGEHSCPGRQFRRHVHHGLAVGDQPLRQVLADPVAALHRPDMIAVAAPECEHVFVAGGVGTESALAENAFGVIEYFDGGRSFMRIHADNNWTQLMSPH